MKLIRALFLSIVTLSCGIAFAQTKTPPTSALGRQVTALSALLSDGYAEEVSDARTYHAVDMYGRGRKDAIVFFTLTGEGRSMYYGFYLAVFERVELINPTPDEPPRYRLLAFTKAGGKGWRHIDFDHIQYSKGQLKILTQEYTDKDPMCCPSKTGSVIYQLKDGVLREMAPNPSINTDVAR